LFDIGWSCHWWYAWSNYDEAWICCMYFWLFSVLVESNKYAKGVSIDIS